MARADVLERYRALPLPSTTDEPWRFTDLKGFDPEAFVSNGHVRGQTPAEAAGSMLELDVAAVATVTEDGIEVERAPEGLTFEPPPDPELLSPPPPPLFGPNLGAGDKFAAHNAVLWEYGVLLQVPKRIVLDKPPYVRIAN